ncbi:MAG: response regulator transcription factor [Leptothrix sp. (in: b-proteobacteria)]
MLPTTLALVDDDAIFSSYLAQYLRDQGVRVSVFGDSNDLLAQPDPHAHGFYVIDLMLPGIDGVDLVRSIRRGSDAGVLVVSGRLAPDVFKQVIEAGADMYLSKPVQFEQIALAIRAVQRRAVGSNLAVKPWTLDRANRQFTAPDGALIELSPIDLVLIDCFVAAAGEVVSREVLLDGLRQAGVESPADGLNATVYRLRRRIERATPHLVPLQTKARAGYYFKAPIWVL